MKIHEIVPGLLKNDDRIVLGAFFGKIIDERCRVVLKFCHVVRDLQFDPRCYR